MAMNRAKEFTTGGRAGLEIPAQGKAEESQRRQPNEKIIPAEIRRVGSWFVQTKSDGHQEHSQGKELPDFLEGSKLSIQSHGECRAQYRDGAESPGLRQTAGGETQDQHTC